MHHHITGLDNLPIELQRNFTLMRDLDSRAQELMKQIDKLGDDYLNNIKIFSVEKKKEHMNEIQKLFNKAKEYGDDKVQLAIQTYELVRNNFLSGPMTWSWNSRVPVFKSL